MTRNPWHSLAGMLLLALPASALAQEDFGRAPPVDTTGLAQGAGSTMEMLYERTIFNIDVLRLTLRFGEDTAAEIASLLPDAPSGAPSDALADSLAVVAMAARNVLVRSRFLRDVSLEQFLDGLRKSLDGARRAGLVSAEAHRLILDEVEEQYEPLREEGIRRGDAMWYRIRGDTLHLAFQRVDGGVPVEGTPIGPERRMGVLGGYLAPDSDFREELLRSVMPDS